MNTYDVLVYIWTGSSHVVLTIVALALVIIIFYLWYYYWDAFINLTQSITGSLEPVSQNPYNARLDEPVSGMSLDGSAATVQGNTISISPTDPTKTSQQLLYDPVLKTLQSQNMCLDTQNQWTNLPEWQTCLGTQSQQWNLVAASNGTQVQPLSDSTRCLNVGTLDSGKYDLEWGSCGDTATVYSDYTLTATVSGLPVSTVYVAPAAQAPAEPDYTQFKDQGWTDNITNVGLQAAGTQYWIDDGAQNPNGGGPQMWNKAGNQLQYDSRTQALEFANGCLEAVPQKQGASVVLADCNHTPVQTFRILNNGVVVKAQADDPTLCLAYDTSRALGNSVPLVLDSCAAQSTDWTLTKGNSFSGTPPAPPQGGSNPQPWSPGASSTGTIQKIQLPLRGNWSLTGDGSNPPTLQVTGKHGAMQTYGYDGNHIYDPTGKYMLYVPLMQEDEPVSWTGNLNTKYGVGWQAQVDSLGNTKWVVDQSQWCLGYIGDPHPGAMIALVSCNEPDSAMWTTPVQAS